jgi:hypothetical protein
MVNFEEQLDFYIQVNFNLTIKLGRQTKDDFTSLWECELFSRSLALQARMFRELLRNYDYQKERGDAFHKLYQKSLDDTLKIITENNLDDKYLCY